MNYAQNLHKICIGFVTQGLLLFCKDLLWICIGCGLVLHRMCMGFAWGWLGFALDSAWDSHRISIQFAKHLYNLLTFPEELCRLCTGFARDLVGL